MVCAEHQTMDGKRIHNDNGFELLEGAFGYPMSLFNRGRLAEVLLEGLRDREKHIKTGKRLTKIINASDSVQVEFEDGTTEGGSIVVGCDGIWSTVRELMCEQAPDGLFDNSPNPYEAPFTGIFASIPQPEELEPGTLIHMHGSDKLAQVFVSSGEAFIITYQRIPSSKKRTYFRHSDVEDLAGPWLDVRVSYSLTIGDLWKKKSASGTANFDEGVLDWWHWNRMVLLGDAAHKMGPIRGAGACSGIEDAIALTNHIKKALRNDSNPSKQTLRQVFAVYQHERESPARLWLNLSQANIDLFTSKTGPKLKAAIVADYKFLPLVVDGPILNDLPFEDEKQGAVRWRRRAKTSGVTEKVKARL